jgi:hypothetical protein
MEVCGLYVKWPILFYHRKKACFMSISFKFIGTTIITIFHLVEMDRELRSLDLKKGMFKTHMITIHYGTNFVECEVHEEGFGDN